eukprot:463692_1
MGNFFDKALKKIKKQKNVIVVGLDAAGKTTMQYQLKKGDIITTVPSLHLWFGIHTFEYIYIYKNIAFIEWDTGGQEKIRPIYRHYYPGLDGIIYMIDSNDRQRIEEAGYELHRILCDMLPKHHTTPILILANKQDLPNSMNVNEISNKLQLNMIRHRKWHIQATCAKTGEGLFEGLDWLSETLNKK